MDKVFSKRFGFDKASDVIQLNFMNRELRIGLWNIFHEEICNKMQPYDDEFGMFLWKDIMVYESDEYNSYTYMVNFKDYFLKSEWYKVYDVFELCLEKIKSYWNNFDFQNFENMINSELEKRLSAYRLSKNLLFTPITNKEELSEVDEAILSSSNFTALEGCNEHLKTAFLDFSSREKPNYRNSIEESVHAIESFTKIITGDKKATLGKALKKIGDKIDIHGSLKEAFEKIYGFASDSKGIRHAMLEKSNIDIEDAKYMLISSSAFVNYLIAKCNKAGIELT